MGESLRQIIRSFAWDGEPHTVDLVALPDPYVTITLESVIVGRQARYFRKEGTWHISQWTEVEIIRSMEKELLF